MKFLEKFRKDSKQELSQVLKEFGLRVSKPYGVFPQDVETLVENFLKEKKELTKLNLHLTEENEQLKQDVADLKASITQLKMDMSMFEIPDSTEAQDFERLNKLKKLKNKKVEAKLDDDIQIVQI